MRAFRDHLEACGAAASTIARHLSALRRLADELELDPTIGRVRSDAAPPRPPRALSAAQYEQLLRGPDRRSTRGLRDHAILRLLGDCGLRRSELAALAAEDLEAVQRHHDPRLRPAVAPTRPADQLGSPRPPRQTRQGPLHPPLSPRPRRPQRVVAAPPRGPAPTACSSPSPTAAALPAPLSAAAIGDVVARYARELELPPHLASAHALRHTFCTRLVVLWGLVTRSVGWSG